MTESGSDSHLRKYARQNDAAWPASDPRTGSKAASTTEPFPSVSGGPWAAEHGCHWRLLNSW
jgi:hypothetical protein